MTGTPQGAIISPFLANIYLHPLDQWLSERGYRMVGYADDFVILCPNAEQAQQALADVQTWIEANGWPCTRTRPAWATAPNRGRVSTFSATTSRRVGIDKETTQRLRRHA